MIMFAGNLRKMASVPTSPVSYQLRLGEQDVALNSYLGQTLYIEYQSLIHCVQCGRKTKKSFQGGYCYPCLQRLLECGLCVIHPEKCRCEQEPGCPDDDWAHDQCKQSHIVYLANSSGLKVGITREAQVATRWIDQGARQAVPIMQVANRYQSGMVEVCLKRFVNDRTDWRKLLRNDAPLLDLNAARDQLRVQTKSELQAVTSQFKPDAIRWLEPSQPMEFNYPVISYPNQIKVLSLDKQPKVGGILQGIKGQYLLFDTGVINVRKFAGYYVKLWVG